MKLLLSIKEASARLSVTRQCAYERFLDKPGGLPTVRVGARRLVAAADLEHFVERLRAGTATS